MCSSDLERCALLEITPISPDQLLAQGLEPLPLGYLGPNLDDRLLAGAKDWHPKWWRLADPTARELERFVCGANRIDTHCCGASWEELAPLPEVVDLRAAQPGDRCVHDPSQRLEASRGIEVGHIFQLGRKYSEALDARFTNEAGSEGAL